MRRDVPSPPPLSLAVDSYLKYYAAFAFWYLFWSVNFCALSLWSSIVPHKVQNNFTRVPCVAIGDRVYTSRSLVPAHESCSAPWRTARGPRALPPCLSWETGCWPIGSRRDRRTHTYTDRARN